MTRDVATGFQHLAPLPCQGLRQPCTCGFVPVMEWGCGSRGRAAGASPQAEVGAAGSVPASPGVQQRWLCGMRCCSGFHVLSVQAQRNRVF